MTHTCLKDRLRSGETCTGTFLLFLSGGDIALFLAGLGFDYFILDMEHSALDLSRARDTILAARAAGIAPIVRVPEMHYHLVARVLDAGAEGIMLPRVETREQAEKLVETARYLPEGRRGISTFAGHNDFAALKDIPGFLTECNHRVFLMVQIETSAGVANREAILSTPGLDACFVGTGDLAMNMGHAGQREHPDVVAAVESILATAREHHLLTSLPIRTPESIAYWRERGMTMLSLSTDGGLLAEGAKAYLSQVTGQARRPD